MIFPVFKRVLFWLALFSIAMAFLEAAVVVYLRELYYPGGFSFPLVLMSSKVALTEIFREVATLIMLLATGHIAGRNPSQRFAWFIYCFAVWDIFYYVFLKLLLNWPDSWLTWDILFLLPVVWTGPVIAPILVSLTMIFLSGSIFYLDERYGERAIRWPAMILVAAGSVLVFISFIWDYSTFFVKHYSLYAMFHPDLASLALRNYIPSVFNWGLLSAGELIILSGILWLILTNRIKHSP
jgi:hypothetical protein